MDKEGRFKVLVVDDESSNIEVLAGIVRPKYTMLVAKDGRTAIEIAKSRKPDLILLDVIMPGMSGFDTIAELKRSDITRAIPVIFITGMESAADERRGLTLGAVDYITKPFHDFIVEARIRTHLQVVEYVRTIERMCRIDPLTNIPNRRFFDDRAALEWERAARDETSIGILMIDIDDFKLYNDTYGHPQGDILLKTVASVFKETLERPADFVSRWGGEEFAVLLPETDLNGAFKIAERIRINVEKTDVPDIDRMRTGITVSIGVAAGEPDEEEGVEELIFRADRALYAAKSAGKNTICS